jgi:hypothetical protein
MTYKELVEEISRFQDITSAKVQVHLKNEAGSSITLSLVALMGNLESYASWKISKIVVVFPPVTREVTPTRDLKPEEDE